MANQTKLLRQAVGATICMDTEVTSTGVYPVEGKGIKAYVDSAITSSQRVAANVAASEATDVAGCVTSINEILEALKTAGLMAADPEEGE